MKGYSAQHCLLVMIEKFKEAIDGEDKFGALLSDFSKTFDCINHQLLIVKIDSYGVSSMSTKIIFSYLSNRIQRTKIKNSFNKRSNILHGVPQGSNLGLLLFNIDLTDLFCECDERNIASYADDTPPYTCGTDTQSVIAELQITANKLFYWFEYNHLKANPGKSSINVSIGDVSLTTGTTETLLGIIIDSELKAFIESQFNYCPLI